MADPKETRQWILTNKPTDLPTLTGDKPTFTLESKPLPALEPNQVLLKVLHFSNDPAQRGWISASIAPDRLYVPPVNVGEPMRARAIAEVVASTADNFKTGAHVAATTGWTEYAVLPASEIQPLPPLPANLSETHYLGSLGMTGLTAYYGLIEIARAKPIDRVVVSGAAGATGSMVVQIAKHIIGCRQVLGLAGSDDKCRWVESLGADKCLNYKAASFDTELKTATEGFMTVYFDNVGGAITNTLLTRMARHSRIAACGAISDYNNEGNPTGIQNWFEIIANRIEIRGFIVFDYLEKRAEVMEVFQQAIKAGKIRLDEKSETVVPTRFEDVPRTWLMLFEGKNQGKLVTSLEE